MSVIQLQELKPFDENALSPTDREILNAVRDMPTRAFGDFVGVRITENGNETRELFHRLRDRQFIIGPLENLMTGPLDVQAVSKPTTNPGSDSYGCLLCRRDAELLGIGPKKEISPQRPR